MSDVLSIVLLALFLMLLFAIPALGFLPCGVIATIIYAIGKDHQ